MLEKFDKIKAYSKFQHDYLTANESFLTVGGAAGSSKSYVGLMKHLRHVHDPFYRGCNIRKNSTAIMKPSGLFDESVHLYLKYNEDIKIKLKDQKIVFPRMNTLGETISKEAGAVIAFSHYENRNAAQLYQGLQFSGIMYDEASHSEEEDIWWLRSRLRSKANCPHQIWLTVNPDPDCWLLKYTNWYLNQEGEPFAGRPNPDRNGLVRWLLRVAGEVVWGESREELIIRYGKKHLPHNHEDQVKPISFRGLFGTIDDNPPLLAMQPDYKGNLESLPYSECERLRWGNWYARPTGSNYFSRKDIKEIVAIPQDTRIIDSVRAYDFAGTLPSDSNPSPDYTTSTKMSKSKEGEYIIEEVTRTRITFGKWEDYVLDNARRDGTGTLIMIPEDPNPAAKAQAFMFADKIRKHGYIVITKRSSTKKLDRFRSFAAAVENGIVLILKGCCYDQWNKIHGDNTFFYNELEAFTGDRKKGETGHDDLCDSTSDAFMRLASKIKMPTGFHQSIQEVDLTVSNPLLNINR